LSTDSATGAPVETTSDTALPNRTCVPAAGF